MSKIKSFLNKTNVKNMIFYICLIALPLLQFFIFYILVNVRSIMYLFQNYDGTNYVFDGMKNFQRLFLLFSQTYVKGAFLNTLKVFCIGFFIGLPLALLFSNYIYKKSVGWEAFRILLFIPSIIPSVALTLIFRGVTDSIFPQIAKMINPDLTFIGIMSDIRYAFGGLAFYSVFMGFGTNVLMYVGTMTAIPESIVEAGELDGCNAFREFIYITIPYIWKTFVTFFVMFIGGIFNEQYNVYTFYGQNADPEVYTVGYYLFARTEAASFYDYPILATFGVFLTLIIAPMSLLLRWVFTKFGFSAD